VNIIMPNENKTVQKSVLQEEIKNAINPNNVPKIPTSVPNQNKQEDKNH